MANKTAETANATEKNTGFYNDKWHCVNLAFLTDFMEYTGVGITELANKAGYTRQGVAYSLRRDDMLLSTAEKLLAPFGVQLLVTLIGKPVQTVKTKITLPAGMAVKRKEEKYTGNRLQFLWTTMCRNDITIHDIARDLGITYNGAWYLFSTSDDMKISDLKKIAECEGLMLSFAIGEKIEK